MLLAYENEAITAQQKDEEVDYVIPDETILIQNPIAVVTGASAKAEQFIDFARGDEAQKIFGEKGYRSVNEASSTSPSTRPRRTSSRSTTSAAGRR